MADEYLDTPTLKRPHTQLPKVSSKKSTGQSPANALRGVATSLTALLVACISCAGPHTAISVDKQKYG